MKDFELKFYREWYDALSELSHDDRAEAALALLEYVYDDKIPEDQLIRIVTTLMRNRIDRDKAAHNRRHSHKSPQPSPDNTDNCHPFASSAPLRDNPVNSDNGQQKTENDNNSQSSFEPGVRASARSQPPTNNRQPTANQPAPSS